jgi:hypothetical protein
VFDQGSSTTLQNSLLALNGASNCSGSVLDGGHNLSFGDSSCPAGFAGGDPDLGALQDNGGPAPTISLGPGSAALDQIPATGAGCPTTDERGVARPSGPKCDIGAYELAPPVAKTISASKISATAATLNGIVTPNAGAASVAFQYGTSTSYGSATQIKQVGGVAPTAFSAKLLHLKPNTIYHYRLVVVAMDGSSVGADVTFTTSLVPAISHLTISPRSFRAAGAASGRTGATIAYRDSRRARTTFLVLRCANTSGRRCARPAHAGRFTHADIAGRNRVRFSGRVGQRTLAAGRYILKATPRSSGRVGRTVSVGFTVTR